MNKDIKHIIFLEDVKKHLSFMYNLHENEMIVSCKAYIFTCKSNFSMNYYLTLVGKFAGLGDL